MKGANYVVLDCETGGFDKKSNPILEVALIGIDSITLKEIDRFELYIKPYGDLVIEKKALAANGLKMVDVNAGHDYKNAVKIIGDFFKKIAPNNRAQNRCIVIGHNIQFDIGFLEEIFIFAKKDIYDYISRTQIDTMSDFKRYRPKAEKLTLGKCCEALGIELTNAHRAMPDTEATAKVFIALTMLMQGSEVKMVGGKTEDKKRVTFKF